MKRLMTLEEFSECVRRGVKAGLPYELEKAKVNIKYGKEGHAQLQINRPESNTVIQYVLTFDYQEYLSGNITPESVIANILNNRNLYYVPADCYNLDIFNYNSVKDRIVSRIVSSKPQYTNRLKNRPVKYFENTFLAMVWEFHSTDLYQQEGILARMPVTTEMIEAWGISIDELETISYKNNPILRPAQIRYMNDILKEMGCECGDGEQNGIIIITNPSRQDGAVAVTYPGVRESLMERFGNDVYIIPSSIHECLAISKDSADPQSLIDMIFEINRTVLDTDEFLADDLMEYTQDGQLVSVQLQEKKSPISENCVFA